MSKRRGSIDAAKAAFAQELAAAKSTEKSSGKDEKPDESAAKKRPHRRTRTDNGQINFEKLRRGSYQQSSNAAALRHLSQNMTGKQREGVSRKKQLMKLKKEVSKLKIELADAISQRDEATEIIGTLTRENEELKSEYDEMRGNESQLNREIKILQQKLGMMEEVYGQEKAQTEELESKLDEMEMVLKEKDMQLESLLKSQEAISGAASPQSVSREQMAGLQRHVMTFSGIDDGDEQSRLRTPTEEKLYRQFQEEKRKALENDKKIKELLDKLEESRKMEIEIDRITDEYQEYQNMAEQELETTALESKALETEVIKLASRNAQLEREKNDAIKILEERDEECVMLKHHLDIALGNVAPDDAAAIDGAGGVGGPSMGGDDLAQEFYDYDGGDGEDYEEDDYEDEPYEEEPAPVKEFASEATGVSGKEQETEEKEEPIEVPDVLKEYLHLTASAVKIKHPLVTGIESEALIKKVQGYPFFDYYERMELIMKNEELKLNREKEARARARQGSAANGRDRGRSRGSSRSGRERGAAGGDGLISKFKKWWAAPSGPTHGSSGPVRGARPKSAGTSSGANGHANSGGKGRGAREERRIGSELPERRAKKGLKNVRATEGGTKGSPSSQNGVNKRDSQKKRMKKPAGKSSGGASGGYRNVRNVRSKQRKGTRESSKNSLDFVAVSGADNVSAARKKQKKEEVPMKEISK